MDIATSASPTLVEGNIAVAKSEGLAQLLYRQAATNGQATALVSGSNHYTYGQLYDWAKAIAQQLNALGIRRGDKVGIILPNSPEFVTCFFAVSGLAATVVPVNPLLKSEEISHILADSHAKCLIAHAQTLDAVIGSLPSAPSVSAVIVAAAEPNNELACVSGVKFERLAGQVECDWPFEFPAFVDAEADLAVLVYTSGTTGKPKGAMLTHANLAFSVHTATNSFNFGPGDRFMAVLPLCHIYGLTVVMLGTLSRGGTLVIQEKFEAATCLATLEKERITVLPAVPTMYQFMLIEMARKAYDLSSLRLCISGAASLPVEIFGRIEECFGAPLVEGYGLTEVSCLATFNRLDAVRKVGSVGRPFDGIAVRITDEKGCDLPFGQDQIGEIAIKGPNVMSGYYRQPEASAEVLQDGWFFTGDMAYRDEEGYVFIVGRKKELIIRGGQNIYPREVEEAIMRLKEVVEVAVVGVACPLMGERVKAFVVVRPGCQLDEETVKDHCRTYLAEYKVPRLVEFISALPRNSTGKILKRLLVT